MSYACIRFIFWSSSVPFIHVHYASVRLHPHPHSNLDTRQRLCVNFFYMTEDQTFITFFYPAHACTPCSDREMLLKYYNRIGIRIAHPHLKTGLPFSRR